MGKKITELVEMTNPVTTDLMVAVDDPGGTPATQKMTLANLVIWLKTQLFEVAVSIAATLAGALVTINQSGTGDIAVWKDGGVIVLRAPDQGGFVLVPQAGGFQVITGLVGYNSTIKRLVFQHETHPNPVPIDPRNGLVNTRFETTY